MKVSVALWLFRFSNRNSCISRSHTSTELLDKKLISSFFSFSPSACWYSAGIPKKGSWVERENEWKYIIRYMTYLIMRFCIILYYAKKKRFLTLLRRSICSDLSEVRSCHRATQCFRLHLPRVFKHHNGKKNKTKTVDQIKHWTDKNCGFLVTHLMWY